MSNNSKKSRWFGDSTCDICGKDIHGLLYDAARSDRNEWATMCHECFESCGKGVEWGVGQQYKEDKDGFFYLVAGVPPDEDAYEEESIGNSVVNENDEFGGCKWNNSRKEENDEPTSENCCIVEDEAYYSALEKHLCGSELFTEDNPDNSECFTEYSIRELFCPTCNAWKKLYGVTINTKEEGQLVTLKAGFYAVFYNEIRYRSWRINVIKNDFDLVFAKEVGWSYDNISKIYQAVRQLITNCNSYCDMQKDAYLVLMSAELLESIQQDGIDQPFYDFFMQSDLCRQAIKDRNLIFELITTHSALARIGLIKEQIQEIIAQKSKRKE